MKTHIEPKYFLLSSALNLDGFSEIPENPFRFERLPEKKEMFHCYDTFEWQAWKNKKGLILCQHRLALIDLRNGNPIDSSLLGTTPKSFFPDSITDTALATTLKNLSKIRALMLRGSVATTKQVTRVLDQNEKTVVLLEQRAFLDASGQIRTLFIKITPVRGYPKEFEQLTTSLENCPESKGKTTYKTMYSALLDAANCKPGDYTSKPFVRLDPEEPIQQSACKLLLSPLAIIAVNEPWIAKNIDTEFLHDFRVAIRRTRSILARLKDIFPPDELAQYKIAFRDLGKRTNTLRDQDVYLLQAERFNNLLPPAMREPLEPFFSDLRTCHKKELKTFSRYLASEEHKLFLQQWKSFLASGLPSDPGCCPAAQTKTSAIAVASVKKAWKKVIRHGRDISRVATDTELHALRIDCKKLRYLLEFYASLFPAKKLASVVGQLKTLQDNLGVFVDLSVQQNYLYSYLTSLDCTSKSHALAASLGGLITALFNQREEVRQHFHETFSTFDRQETEELFSELFIKYR